MNQTSPNSSSAAENQLPIGIDLGTTYSLVAYVDAGGRPTTVLNQSGDLLTPSAVAFEDGLVIVGKEAVKGSVLEPDAYADCFKRDMGRGHFHRQVGGHEVPPEVLNGFLLERLKQDAERRLGSIRRVVITVPAFFDEGRRKATQEAGKLAGLEVLDIINEPTAAAVAFGYHQATLRGPNAPAAEGERVLVFDLGGGTFDVTILEVQGRSFRTLATDGDVQLGGKDFDERLVQHFAARFLAAHGVDPRGDASDAAQLWLDAQEAKHALSERQRTTVVMYHAGVRMRLDVTRAEFQELTRDLLERTQSTTAQVVKQAHLDWPQIDRLLLVGGSTRMPMVGEMLKQLAGREPDRSQSADEVVAHGAALYAAMLLGEEGEEAKKGDAERPKFDLVNVNSHSLGVVGLDQRTRQKVNVVLIPKNTPLPCRKVKRFRTARPNQDTVKVAVVEGESQRPEYCIALGECVVRDLPAGLPAGASVDVEYAYAANGTLTVRARVTNARQSSTVEIHRPNAREMGDLDIWRRRLCGVAIPIAAPSAPPEAGAPPADRSAVLREIDELFLRMGQALWERKVPSAWERGQQAALAAAEELRNAEHEASLLEAARRSAASPSEAARCDVPLAQARRTVQEIQTRLRFAQIALGRECARSGFVPADLKRDEALIKKLEAQLRGGS
ncbi:MAG TPA: Hsp70 family protein [Pirellulales bacterium]|nr:Hsp70 family protein [Pirellulales bacterium]